LTQARLDQPLKKKVEPNGSTSSKTIPLSYDNLNFVF